MFGGRSWDNPLHAACSSHASPAVIQALVDSHPPSILIQDEMGWTALHYLTGTAFASLSFSEAEGRDAIASVRMLIERETQCVECVDREGQTPIALLCEVMGSHHDPGWQFIRRRVRSNVQNDNEAGQASAAAIGNLSLEQEDAAEDTFGHWQRYWSGLCIRTGVYNFLLHTKSSKCQQIFIRCVCYLFQET